MKFSLRFVIVFTILAGTGIGLYFNEIQARKPVVLTIENRIGIENEVDRPAHLIEFRSQHNTQQVDVASGKYLRSRLKETQKDFSRFQLSFHYADELLEKYPLEMRKAAEAGLEHESLSAVIEAAATLERFGDARGMKELKQRLLKYGEGDDKDFWELLRYFKEAQPEFNAEEIELLTEIANSKARDAEDAAFLLRKLNIDAEPLQRHLRHGDVDTDSLVWLLQQQSPSDLVLAAVAKKLAKAQASYSSIPDLQQVVFELASEDSRFDSLARQAEEKIAEYLLRMEYKDEWREGKSWSLLEKYATPKSIPFLESQLADCDSIKMFSRILAVLQRLGGGELAERNFRARLTKAMKARSKSRYMWFSEDRMRDELLRIAPPFLGPEETVELCIKASSKSLAEFVEDTRDGSAAKRLGCDPGLLEAARQKAIERLKQESFQSAGIGRKMFPEFARRWYENGQSRQKAVDWINQKFAPSKKLTVQMVLDNEKYPEDHGLWYTWSRFDGGVRDIHTFTIVALAHSGNGNLAHWEYTHPNCVTSSIEEYAEVESNEFQVGSYDRDGSFLQSYSINVNRRSYHFDVSGDGNGSDDRYDVGAIVEIMNTIAVRQRLKKRFFIYETLPEVGYCLVMHLTTDQAHALEEEFGFSPARGSDYYLAY